MIPTLPFGSTGHQSARLIFGAAALARASQAEADAGLERLCAAGLNHIDVAASYGDAEVRLAPWLRSHRAEVFLASKTGERDYAGAREQLRRSLERLGVEQLDLIQLHNLVKPEEHERAFAEDGALRALLEARDEGLVRFIGVTGHGTRVAGMHLESLHLFPFDSVLLPYNYAMLQNSEYAADFARLLEVCRERGVAVQTIKSLARRRWPEGSQPTHSTWYEPFRDPADIVRGVHWALGRPGIFINSSSDLSLLWEMVRAVESYEKAPSESEMREHSARLGVKPLFVRGYAA